MAEPVCRLTSHRLWIRALSTKEKLLASAQKLIAKGQLPRAVKDYEELVKLDPKDLRNRQKLAELYSRARMTAEAIEAFEKVAGAYVENGYLLKAIAVYKQAQRLDPARISISLKLAELNQRQGLVGNALAEYRAVVDSHEKNGRIQQAVDILGKMKDLDPENINIRVKIIETHLQHGAPLQARAELGETIEMLEGRHDNSRLNKLFEFFLPRFPDDPLMQVGQASLLLAKAEAASAVALLTSVLTEKPDDFAALRRLAEGYRQLGDFAAESDVYRRLLQGRPDDLKLRIGQVRALLDGGEGVEALRKLEEWKRAFAEAGQLKALKHFYERLAVQMPDDPRVAQTLRSLNTAAQRTKDEEASSAPVEDLPEVRVAEVPASPPPSPPEELEGAEEIPLEFLEGFDEAPSVSAESVSIPEAPPAEQPLAEEIELDLDFSFDLDDEVPEPHHSLTDEFIAPEGEADSFEADFLDALPDFLSEEEEKGIEEEAPVFSAVPLPTKRREIKTDVEVEDAESHYNLGIAYKEMGLLEEAVAAFDKAARQPSLAVGCLTLKGMCLAQMGMAPQAEEAFQNALSTPDLAPEVRAGLLYELGLLYEGWGREDEAREQFQAVAEIDPSFRQVGEKLRPQEGRGGAGKKERISYI